MRRWKLIANKGSGEVYVLGPKLKPGERVFVDENGEFDWGFWPIIILMAQGIQIALTIAVWAKNCGA